MEEVTVTMYIGQIKYACVTVHKRVTWFVHVYSGSGECIGE